MVLAIAMVAPIGAAPAAASASKLLVANQASPSPSSSPTASPGIVTLDDLGFVDQTVLAGQTTMHLNLPIRPGTAVTDDSSFTIRYTPSPLLDFEHSSITVSLNGEPRVSDHLSKQVGDERSSIKIPLRAADALANPSFLRLDLSFELVLPDSTCPPAVAPDRWLVVSSTSTLKLGITSADTSMGLQNLLDLFLPQVVEADRPVHVTNPQPITIVIGQGSTPEEYEAAGLVALTLGRWGESRNIDPVVTFSDQIPPGQPVIVVATGNRFAGNVTWGDVSWNGTYFSTPAGAISDSLGVLALQRTSNPQLLVGSQSPDGVLDAARALADPGRLAALSGSYDVLTGRIDVPTDRRSPPWNGNVASFHDLGVSARTITGLDNQTTQFVFTRPAGWEISGSASVVIDTAVTGNVSPDASMTATVNGVPVGSLAITSGGSTTLVTGGANETASIQYLQFNIPAGVLNAPATGYSKRDLVLKLQVSLGAGSTCSSGTPPTVTIEPTSWWKLPHTTSSTLDLSAFPAPLTGNPQAGVTPLVVVLPDSPSADEQDTMLAVMAAMGRWSAGDDRLLPHVTVASRLNGSDRDNANLIAIGTPQRNTVVNSIVSSQNNVFTLPTSPTVVTLSSPVSGQVGLVPSPWNRGRAALVVTSWIDQGIPVAASAFDSADGLAQFSGSIVSINGDQPPVVLADDQRLTRSTSGLVDRFGWGRWWTFTAIIAIIVVLIVGSRISWAMVRRGSPDHRR